MDQKIEGIGKMGAHGEDAPGTCPICGLPASRWKGNDGRGYLLKGERYCCQPCAEDRGCICLGQSQKERSMEFEESGATLARRNRKT